MTDQQTHLKQVLEQQKGLIEEINALNSQITSKREMAVKLQGIAEYLDQTRCETSKRRRGRSRSTRSSNRGRRRGTTKKDK